MSEYTFRIWFSGSVHFVENRDPNAKCQLCIVLPRGDNDPAYRKHTGAIYEPDKKIRCGVMRLEKGKKILDLTRRRVAFEIQRFDDLPPQNVPKLSSTGILNMEDIVGIFADENDQVVSALPPVETVLAQILIGKGYTLGHDPSISVLREWRIPETLTGFSEYKVVLADPVYVDIPRVRRVRMHYMPIDGPQNEAGEPEPDEPPSPVELRQGGNNMIEIFIANRCEGDGCVKAEDFEWRRERNKWTLMQIDRDFELNYKMLHPTTLQALKKLLSSNNGLASDEVRFPVPESPFLEIGLAPHLCFELPAQEKERLGAALGPVVGPSASSLASPEFALESLDMQDLLNLLFLGTGTGSGSDCNGGRGKGRFNDLDEYMPDPDAPSDRALVQAKYQETRGKAGS